VEGRIGKKAAQITYVAAGTVYCCTPELILMELVLRESPVTVVKVVLFPTDIKVVVSSSSDGF
jgi:hypothetical protein